MFSSYVRLPEGKTHLRNLHRFFIQHIPKFQGALDADSDSGAAEAGTPQPMRSRLNRCGPTVSGTSHPTESQ